MDDRTKLEIDLFSVQAGNWHEYPANISVADTSGNRVRSSRGNLYILIETSHKNWGPALYGQLIDAITDTYYNLSGSITRGLRAALMRANEQLFESNLRADSEHRFFAGLGCLVVREGDAYIGQIGPGLATHIHQGTLTRYPTESVWQWNANPGAFDLNREPPAGMRREIEPGLYHLSLAPGDLLLLSTTALARASAPEDLLQTLSSADGRSAREKIGALAGNQEVSAVVITVAELAPPLPRLRGMGERALPDQPPPSEESSERVPSAPLATAPPVPQAPPVSQAPPPFLRARAPSGKKPLFGRAERATAEPIAPKSATPKAAPQGEDDWEEVQAKPAGPPSVDLNRLRGNLSEGAQKLRYGTQEFLMRILPDSLPERSPASKPPDRGDALSLSGRSLVAVALAIPLVMLLIVITTRVQYDRTRRTQFNDLKIQAQTAYDTAVSNTQDVNYTRQGLREALATTGEGLALDPNDETLNALDRRIQVKLDEIDGVQRLYHYWQLADLQDDATSATDSSRVVVNGIDVYLLNRGSGLVYKYMLNDVGDALQPVENSPILAQKGEARGGVTLGDMVDMAWMRAGGQRTKNSLVVLERTGILLSYDPQQGIDVLPVADSDLWLKPQAIASYFGNLYVLDPLLGRILKYVPTDNAYTTPPADYLDPQVDLDLTGVVDMAIDGNLYVLFADGKIVKFMGGQPQPFNMASLPTPMRSPTTLFVSGPQEPDAAGYAYVTDTGNNRIVQFDKNGNFIRQFQAKPGDPQLQRLRGLYVDEESRRMFILSGKTLWLAELPPLG